LNYLKNIHFCGSSDVATARMPLGQILDLRVKPVVIAQRRLKDRLIMPMTPHMDIAGKLEHQRLRFAAAGTGTSNRWQIKAEAVPFFDENRVWVNTVLGNLKTGFSGAYHTFKFRKYAQRYLSTMTHRFNRRFRLEALPMSLLRAAVSVGPRPERWLRSAEASC
jgi:hypothetical protein